jgi:hypothetical protein
MQGQTTDEGTDHTLDAKRLTLMSARVQYVGHTDLVDVPEVKWFAVRCVFDCDASVAEPGETSTFEERVTLWQATTFEEAITLAEAEADTYAADVNSRYRRGRDDARIRSRMRECGRLRSPAPRQIDSLEPSSPSRLDGREPESDVQSNENVPMRGYSGNSSSPGGAVGRT